MLTAHLGDFQEQEAVYEQEKVWWEIVVEFLEDQQEDGDEINVVWTENMMDGRRCPWPVLHGRKRSEVPGSTLHHPDMGSKSKKRGAPTAPAVNTGLCPSRDHRSPLSPASSKEAKSNTKPALQAE